MEITVPSPKLLGSALRRIRRLKKLNQTEAGRDFVLDQTTISSIESGAEGTRIETIFRLLASLELEMVIRTKDHKADSSDEW